MRIFRFITRYLAMSILTEQNEAAYWQSPGLFVYEMQYNNSNRAKEKASSILLRKTHSLSNRDLFFLNIQLGELLSEEVIISLLC